MSFFIFRNTSAKMLCASLAYALLVPHAHAYRPFDGTDASTAEAGTFELEVGATRLHKADQRTLGIPAFTANFGLAHDTEIVIDGRFEHQQGNSFSGSRDSLTDTALSLKHVWRQGSLQDKSGISIASECGILLPTVHAESGTGATCAGIFSQKWSMAAAHLNLGVTRTRDHDNLRIASVIVEGPEEWTVRPVMELSAERSSRGTHSSGKLIGMIWKLRDNLALDAGVRRLKEDGETGHEIRLGATWSTPF